MLLRFSLSSHNAHWLSKSQNVGREDGWEPRNWCNNMSSLSHIRLMWYKAIFAFVATLDCGASSVTPWQTSFDKGTQETLYYDLSLGNKDAGKEQLLYQARKALCKRSCHWDPVSTHSCGSMKRNWVTIPLQLKDSAESIRPLTCWTNFFDT